MNRTEKIRKLLRENLCPSYLEVVNISEEHAGHAGHNEESHYKVIIACDQFAQLSQVQSHKLIYASLAEVFSDGLHSLTIQIKA